VLLGPELADVVRPASIGSALQILVGFAIAAIVFEGGLNLDVRRLRREGRLIRRLVTLGAIVTAVGATVAARAPMGWDWSRSTLFGVLVIVTGPTVVTPLVRRIGLARNLRTVLEAEGVIDAVGALVAVVTLEIVVRPSGEALLAGVTGLGLRLGFGLVAGLAGGAAIALLLRVGVAVPEGLENVLTLSLVVALFQGTNAVLPESGILAVIVAGLVVGNVKSHVQRSLLEFKEQLTVMLVGMLFVLLAADVRLHQVYDLGVPGLLTVGALMLVVRPATVLARGAGAEGREESEEDRLHEGCKLPHLSSAQREPPVPAQAPRNSRDVGRVGLFGTDRAESPTRYRLQRHHILAVEAPCRPAHDGRKAPRPVPLRDGGGNPRPCRLNRLGEARRHL
jgi:NhaP-type Na+/H+ or K+/H+ antiporter